MKSIQELSAISQHGLLFMTQKSVLVLEHVVRFLKFYSRSPLWVTLENRTDLFAKLEPHWQEDLKPYQVSR